MDTLTSILRALSDPTRRAIFDLLRDGGRPVGELAAHFSVSRPAISKHLRALSEAGLAVAETRGRQRIYALETEPLGEVREWLDRYWDGEGSEQRPSGPREADRREGQQTTIDPGHEDSPENDWKVW